VNIFSGQSNSKFYRVGVTHALPLFVVAVIASLFIIDTFAPIDIGAPVFYVVIVLLVASNGSRPAVLITACVVAVLIPTGYMLSHYTGDTGAAVVRCVASLFAIIATLILSLRNIKKTRQLCEQIGLLHLAHDADAAFEHPQKDLLAAIDAIPGMLWSASDEGEVIFVNRRWEESNIGLGGSCADLWQAIVHPDDLKNMRRDWQASVASGQMLDNVSRVRHTDGSYRWTRIAAEPLRDAEGAVRCWYGINSDVDARKRAEDMLMRNEVLLADAQRLTKTGSIAFSTADGEMVWSAEAYHILGYEPGPNVAPSLELILARTHPDDRADVEAAHRYGEGARSLVDIEYRLLLPAGVRKYVRYVAHFPPPAPINLAYVGALTDITDAQQSQEALTRSTAEFAHITRLTTLGELATSIAHEVAQPMAAVVTSGDAALRWLRRAQPDVEEVERAIGQTIKSAQRANDIVRKIRAMAQRRSAAYCAIHLSDVVDDAVQLMSREFRRHDVCCEVQQTNMRLLVRGDAMLLQQVIVNLLTNAVQAMSEHSGGRRIIHIGTEAMENNKVRLSIEDTGPGINAEDRDRLFEPFYTTNVNGIGIGLSLCRSIVEAHGGRISADTQCGAGALFRLTLPLDTEQRENVT
jgi:PAS domain S-box-containing protein